LSNSKKYQIKDQSDTLVVHSPKFPDIQEIQKFCKQKQMPITEISTKSVYDAAKKVHKELDSRGLTKLIIIGDNEQFPCLEYKWEKEKGYTDIIYNDPHKDGNLSVNVGRVYGSTETVLAHLDGVYGDSNEAVVFDTTPRRNELPVQALESLGFRTYLASSFTNATRVMMERAEFILQYSDGTIYDRVHGNPDRWYGGKRPRKLLDYYDVSLVKFQHYPIVYAEACYTANFGSLLYAFMTQKAVYVGSTSPTYNNNRECDSWDTCHTCDGFKYGFLDLLDSRDTIGSVKRDVEAKFLSTLPNDDCKKYTALLHKKKSEIKSVALLSSIQNILFGNPNRPTTVGAGAGRFDIKTIPVTVY